MVKKGNLNQPARVALYIRVSGEEQKIHGLSLEAQQERLEKFAREKGWIISGVYIDAAKTARKNMHKRAEFIRMMDDVKADRLDILLFCRLDRWFRSVSDYYKVVEVLHEHNCEWITTDEEYDTTTANGRLYINVKLSIAQNEADIDGERIDVVFDSKIANGTVLSGNAPFGYRVNSEKRLEIVPENAAIVQDAFNYFELTSNRRKTHNYIRETYGVSWNYNTFSQIFLKKVYTGVYDKNGRSNDHFCEPIIDLAQFSRVQELLKINARTHNTGRIYIFSSLIVCSNCGRRYVGNFVRGIYYYRCNQAFVEGTCNSRILLKEEFLETWLFDHLHEVVDAYSLSWSVSVAAKRKTVASSNKAALKGKLTKLKELYLNDLINIDDYKKDYELYTAALAEIPEPVTESPPDFSAIRHLLSEGFRDTYNTFSREDKRSLWRSVIKEIRIDDNKNITDIIFT